MADTADNTATAAISTAERTHAEWLTYFVPEGEEHVRRRQELGDWVANPERCARIYASFAAFDAIKKGGAFRQIDLQRARNIAEIMVTLPTGLTETERKAA
jgi:hypothetical protein